MPKFVGMPRRFLILWKRSVDLLGIPAAAQRRLGFWLLPRSKNIKEHNISKADAYRIIYNTYMI